MPCLAGENASATCLKILVMRPAEVQWPAPLSLLPHFEAQYKFLVNIIIIIILIIIIIIVIKMKYCCISKLAN